MQPLGASANTCSRHLSVADFRGSADFQLHISDGSV